MYEETNKKSIIKLILSGLFFAIFFFIMSSIIFNSCRMSDAEISDDVIFDEITINAYNKNKTDFKVYAYDIEKRFEAVEANQLLQIKYLYYIPEALQMQVTIKYNTSYAKMPTKDYIPFELILKDEEGNILNDYFYEPSENDGYGYIRVCWNGVEFSDSSEYTLHINQNVNGKTVTRGTFLMQKATTAYKEIKLTKNNAPYIFSK